jgi:parvulin-like peptidyl-prolyl isomerase
MFMNSSESISISNVPRDRGAGTRFFRLILVLCLALPMLSMCANADQGEDGIVLVVGSRKISGTELKEKINEFIAGLSLPKQEWSSIKKDLLQRAIDEYVVLEYGREAGIVVTDRELETAVHDITTDYGEDEFKKMLLHQYVDLKSWKDKLREQILIRKIQEEVTGDAAPPSSEEIKTYYQDHQAEFALPAMIKFRQVVTSTAKEAKTVLAALKSGGRFSELAKQYSTAPEAENGGEVGWVAAGQLEESMEKALLGLKVGEISPVVKTPYGYHVFQLMAVRPEGTRPLSEAMVGIETKLSDQKREEAWRAWLTEQQKRFLVKINSEIFDRMEMS